MYAEMYVSGGATSDTEVVGATGDSTINLIQASSPSTQATMVTATVRLTNPNDLSVTGTADKGDMLRQIVTCAWQTVTGSTVSSSTGTGRVMWFSNGSAAIGGDVDEFVVSGLIPASATARLVCAADGVTMPGSIGLGVYNAGSETLTIEATTATGLSANEATLSSVGGTGPNGFARPA